MLILSRINSNLVLKPGSYLNTIFLPWSKKNVLEYPNMTFENPWISSIEFDIHPSWGKFWSMKLRKSRTVMFWRFQNNFFFHSQFLETFFLKSKCFNTKILEFIWKLQVYNHKWWGFCTNETKIIGKRKINCEFFFLAQSDSLLHQILVIITPDISVPVDTTIASIVTTSGYVFISFLDKNE